MPFKNKQKRQILQRAYYLRTRELHGYLGINRKIAGQLAAERRIQKALEKRAEYIVYFHHTYGVLLNN